MINLKINDMPVSVPEGTTILRAARSVGVHIPTLCYLDMHEINMVNKFGTCRVCMVEMEGSKALVPACATDVIEGMAVHTSTQRTVVARRETVELILSNHPKDCLYCARNLTCELQALASELGIREKRYEGERIEYTKDKSSKSIVRNPNKCVLCRRCLTACNDVQTVDVYSMVDRGFGTTVGTPFNMPLVDTACTFCGACVSVCPTAALIETDDSDHVWKALNDPDKFVVVQTAPAVRVSLGEEFLMPIGSRVTGKMVAALRRMGFNKVLDTDFAADLTIMEEAAELIHRLQHGGRLPMLTSCCPAWVKFIEHQFPELLDVPSSCKSPHEMFGIIAKTYLAKKLGIAPEKMIVVSIMPCIAKKYEAARDELAGDTGLRDVDFVLSTRELARMIKEAGLNFTQLPDEGFDSVMGESTGAGVIFGTTGGVIEAVARTAAHLLSKSTQVDYQELRGTDGVREATIRLGEYSFNIAIAHGLGNARKVLEMVRDGSKHYHAIEIMACPGGCIGGGGQPYHKGDISVLKKRMTAIYEEDKSSPLRASHLNKEVKQLYDEFLGSPYSEKAKTLLHTSYVARERF